MSFISIWEFSSGWHSFSCSSIVLGFHKQDKLKILLFEKQKGHAAVYSWCPEHVQTENKIVIEKQRMITQNGYNGRNNKIKLNPIKTNSSNCLTTISLTVQSNLQF